MDGLEVGNGGMTDDEYKLHFSMWYVSANRLLFRHITSMRLGQ